MSAQSARCGHGLLYGGHIHSAWTQHNLSCCTDRPAIIPGRNLILANIQKLQDNRHEQSECAVHA